MNRKKIAIYVEGQTEQIFIYHLLLQWLNPLEINITPLKLFKDKVRDRLPDHCTDENNVLFLIMDVQGEGSINSAIADRCVQQQKDGFEIMGLRDLLTDNYAEIKADKDVVISSIRSKFKEALNVKKCVYPDKIELFFAVMEIEAWLIAFHSTVVKWAGISEIELIEKIKQNSVNKDGNIEGIRRPSNILWKKKAKSFKSIISFAKKITREDIEKVYQDNKVPYFNEFWNKLQTFFN